VQRIKAEQELAIATSPYGKLCHLCSAPATHAAEYTYGTRYFCDRHWPPPKTLPAYPFGQLIGLDPTERSFPSVFVIVAVLLILIPNFVIVLVHILSRGQIFKPTLPGAVVALIVMVGVWIWFAVT